MSYVHIPSNVLAPACWHYLEECEKEIAAEREALIRKEMARRWLPAKTREQAIRRLQDASGCYMSPWAEAALPGGFVRQTVRNLLGLIDLGKFGFDVQIEDEVFSVLKPYLVSA